MQHRWRARALARPKTGEDMAGAQIPNSVPEGPGGGSGPRGPPLGAVAAAAGLAVLLAGDLFGGGGAGGKGGPRIAGAGAGTGGAGAEAAAGVVEELPADLGLDAASLGGKVHISFCSS